MGGGIALSLAPRLPTSHGSSCSARGSTGSPLTRSALLPRVAAEAVHGLAYAARGDHLAVFARVAWHFTVNFVRRPYAQYRILRVIVRSFHCMPPLALDVPTVIVSVADDRFFRTEGARWLSEKILRSTLEVAGGIHLWVLIDHERAAETIIRLAQ